MQTFELIKSILNTFWENNGFQWFFYLALVAICLKEKEQWMRQTFFWYPLLVFLGLLSPMAVYVGNYIWDEVVAYFCRQFSLVPYFCVMAYGFVLLSRSLAGAKRFAVVCVLTAFILLLGTPVYKRTGYEYHRSENFYKIPQELIDICDRLREEGDDITLATPTHFSHSVRQYDPSFHMITGTRDVGALPTNLASETPDVAYIMSACCASGCDYAVVNKSESAREAFDESGYEPFYETAGYLVYACEGSDGYKKEYNERDEIVGYRYYDADGKPRVTDAGYASIRYDYDDAGNKTGEYYFDVNDRPFYLEAGYAGIHYVYDGDRRVIKTTYTDADGNPVGRTDVKYASVVYEYDADGNQSAEWYLNAKDRPTYSSERFAGWRRDYIKVADAWKESKISFYDRNGMLLMRPQRYAVQETAYDDNGYVIQYDYFDEREQRTNLPDGYARIEYERDENGNSTKVSYFAKDDQPVRIPAGYASIAYVFNEKNLVTEEYYFDEKGNPVALGLGQEGVKKEYNDANRVSRLTYVDSDGSPLETVRLYSAEAYVYDLNGNTLSVRYYDTEGNATASDGGYAGYDNKYDESNRLVQVVYLDTEGNPVMNTSGYAILVRSYDENGQNKDTYYDTNEHEVSL